MRRNNNINVELEEFRNQACSTVRESRSITILNLYIFPLNITQVSQSFSKRITICIRRVTGGFTRSRHISYARHFPWLSRQNSGGNCDGQSKQKKQNKLARSSHGLSNHAIRSRQHIRRNYQADLLRGFEIDD